MLGVREVAGIGRVALGGVWGCSTECFQGVLGLAISWRGIDAMQSVC